MNGADQGPINFTAPYTHEWNPALNGPGTYDWEATAYDRGGNQQTSATVRVTYGLCSTRVGISPIASGSSRNCC
jgi:hypothetical protein